MCKPSAWRIFCRKINEKPKHIASFYKILKKKERKKNHICCNKIKTPHVFCFNERKTKTKIQFPVVVNHFLLTKKKNKGPKTKMQLTLLMKKLRALTDSRTIFLYSFQEICFYCYSALFLKKVTSHSINFNWKKTPKKKKKSLSL